MILNEEYGVSAAIFLAASTPYPTSSSRCPLHPTLPGLLHPVQDLGDAFATGAVVDGTDDLAGRRLMAIRTAPPSGAVVAGTVFIDVAGPWAR